MKKTIGERIKERREELNMSQDELAAQLGYKSRSSITKIEKDGRELPQKKILAISQALNVTPSFIMGWEDNNVSEPVPISIMPERTNIPIFKYIPASCGFGSWSDDDVVDYISLPSSIYKFNKRKRYFAQTAQGDSMTGVQIEDGDLLIFEQYDSPENNMVGVFTIDNERCFCKRIKFIDGKIFLVSANDNYMPIEITSDMQFRMVGLLKYVVKEFRQSWGE